MSAPSAYVDRLGYAWCVPCLRAVTVEAEPTEPHNLATGTRCDGCGILLSDTQREG